MMFYSVLLDLRAFILTSLIFICFIFECCIWNLSGAEEKKPFYGFTMNNNKVHFNSKHIYGAYVWATHHHSQRTVK